MFFRVFRRKKLVLDENTDLGIFLSHSPHIEMFFFSQNDIKEKLYILCQIVVSLVFRPLLIDFFALKSMLKLLMNTIRILDICVVQEVSRAPSWVEALHVWSLACIVEADQDLGARCLHGCPGIA